MQVFTKGKDAAGFILSEASGKRSRDEITISSGAGIVQPGTALGKVTATGEYLPSSNVAADGSEVAVALNIYRVDATLADQKVAAITRDAEVIASELSYHASRDLAAEKLEANVSLAAKGIIVR